MDSPKPLLEVDNLQTHFSLDEGVFRAVDGVSFQIPAGRIVCVVGESGCGKSVTARSILGLVDQPGEVVGGHVWWHPEASSPQESKPGGPPADAAMGSSKKIDLAQLPPRSDQMRSVRGNEIAMIFQEPMASISPMYTVGTQLIEAIRLHLPLSKAEAADRAVDLLRQVGIPDPTGKMSVYPFQLSGGMCQRVMIAIALSCSPRLLIADEPTTALDVTSQSRIIDLLAELRESTGMAIMFVTHDMGVVAEIADEVVVMYSGTVMEKGPVDAIFHDPQHPYTKGLLGSVPVMGRGRQQKLSTIPGQVPAPFRLPEGCRFNPRCEMSLPDLCNVEDPGEIDLAPDRQVRCWLHHTIVHVGSPS